MRKEKVYINSCDWDIIIYFDYDCICRKEVLDELGEFGISKKRFDRAKNELSKCLFNTGMTYSSFIDKSSIVVIGRASSSKEFAKTYIHEIGHCATHIIQYLGISPYGEDIRYIEQEIVENTWNLAEFYILNNNRRKDNEKTRCEQCFEKRNAIK